MQQPVVQVLPMFFGNFYVYDLVGNTPISNSYTLLPTDTHRSVINENGDLEIYINDRLEETIDL